MITVAWRLTVFWCGKTIYYRIFPVESESKRDYLGVPDRGRLLFSILAEGGAEIDLIELLEELGNQEIEFRRLRLKIVARNKKHPKQ